MDTSQVDALVIFGATGDLAKDYATASLKLNNIDTSTPAVMKMLDLLRYVDGDQNRRDQGRDPESHAPGARHRAGRTYAAVRLAADSWRWDGVPILIRAGKCLPVTATEVSVLFKRPPYEAFGEAAQNSLRFRINPDKVTLTLAGKKPGADMRPYDRLIGAALNGERWLFAAQETVEAAWRVVESAGETWHNPSS
ncbi:MAG TPA: hypothetical protein VFB06_30155 [Streptosporangiaceae bacterium]|nr:hypothetical protein [Streptosporangiaceae bacterium]